MTEQLFSMPIEITAMKFDSRGHGYPTRINYQGRSIWLEHSANGEMISFRDNGAYFWLTRKGKNWCIAPPGTIL